MRPRCAGGEHGVINTDGIASSESGVGASLFLTVPFNQQC